MIVKLSKTKGQWYWKMVARNGKVLCHSEKYHNKKDAIKAARIVNEACAIEEC